MNYGYTRISIEDKRRKQISIDAQKKALEDYCKQRDISPLTILEDVGFSAKSLNRPAIQELFKVIQKDDVVLVYRLDRLFRSVMDMSNTLNDWNKQGVQLVSVTEAVETQTPQGRAMLQMSSVFSELERSMISQRTSEALQYKKSQGFLIGGVPYGYNLDKDKKSLKVNLQEQKVLKKMRTMRNQGKSYRFITDYLNKNVKPKNGNKWFLSVTFKILKKS